MPRRKTIKIILIVILILILVIIAVRALVLYNEKQSQFEEKRYDTPADFYTVEEVARYMDCEYIREEEPKNESYDLDIYLKFKYDLYTDGASNKDYFYRAIVLFAQVTEYQNIRLIDEERDILIAIYGDPEEEKISKLYINGKENYFGETDTLQELDKYTSASTVRIDVNSPLLQDIIKNDWDTTKVNLGSQESTLDEYEIYFDEGYRVKKRATTIFNIEFTDKYTEPVVNNIKVGTSFEEIQNQMGTPAFGGTEYNFIGYMSYNLYVFFWEDRISVYKVDSMTDEQQFLTLFEKFRQDLDLRSFVNELTNMWPDYSYYAYDTDYLQLTYILKGIDIKINIDMDNGVTFYSNYNGSYLQDLIEQKDNLPSYTYFNNDNLVYLNEYSKVRTALNRDYVISDFDKEKNLYEINRNRNIGEKQYIYEKYSNKYVVYRNYNNDNTYKISIISINEDYPDSEIKENISSYLWLDDIKLIYSIKNKGIYLYNSETREKSTIIEGKDNFDIKDYENNKIYYDDKEMLYILDSNLPQRYDSIIWLDSENLAYSIKNTGIYKYNINTKETNTIIEGTEEFNLIKYENGRIYYDNTNIIYLLN